MSKKATRAVISAGVLFGALTFLLYTTMSSGAEYYKHVDEVMASPQQWYGKALQLHGFVVEDSIARVPDTLQYRFKIKNGDATVDAYYTGVVPDTFKGGSEVVLKGHLTAQGFQTDPNGVMAKCPSKYQPAK